MQTDLSDEMLEYAKGVFSTFADRPWRKNQREAVRWILEQDRKVSVLSAPTGSGKSLCGASVLAMYGGGTYLCSSKALQNQIAIDYPEFKVLMGRNNYTCSKNEGLTAAECTHSKISPCRHKHDCPYELQKKLVLSSRFKVLNYTYFLFEANFVGQFSNLEYLVCDEGDTLEGQLSAFISLNIPLQTIKNYKVGYPSRKTSTAKDGVESWKDWGAKFKNKVNGSIGKLMAEAGEWDSISSEWQVSKMKQLNRARNLLSKLNMFTDYVDENWLMEVGKFDKRIRFYPDWIVPELAEKYFWQHSEKFLLMSATFQPVPVLSKLLGLPPGDVIFKEVPSIFPEKNRRVVASPVANLTFKTFDSEVHKLIDKIEEILMHHINDKGLILSVSFKLNKFIMDNVNTGRLITHDSKNRAHILQEFKNAVSPLVLVSPSYERGISLDDDLGRFCILVKCPYLSLGDKQVSKRLYGSKLGGIWFKSEAAQTIVQGAGRIVRSESDWGVTYILDRQIMDLITKHPSYFPRHFIDAIEFG